MPSLRMLLNALTVLFALGLALDAAAQPAGAAAVAPAARPAVAEVAAVATPAPVLRPGDLLFISLPGEDAFNADFAVDRNGRVLLPELGTIDVAGLSLDVARETLVAALARVFLEPQRLQLVLKERRVLLTVLGYVQRPGDVDLTEGASVQAALNAAGGLLSGAQLDRLQLRRDGKSIVFDFKHYLDSGDVEGMPALESMDVLFVPASPLMGNVQMEFDPVTMAGKGDAGEDKSAIKVFGEVNAPGSFTYKEDSNVVDMLMRAGSVTRFAGVERIRVISMGEPQLFDLKKFLDTGDRSLLPALEPGATIFVPIQSDDVKTGANTLYVMGEVLKPGAYESGPGVSFMQILANAGGPTRFADTRQLRIIKADGSVEKFDLTNYTEFGKDELVPSVGPGDAIFVPEKAGDDKDSWLSVGATDAVRIIGAVRSPGRFEWSDEMSLMDLLAHAGGPTERADIAHLQILGDERSGAPGVVRFDLERYIDSGGASERLPVVRSGYTVIVPDLPQNPNDNKSQWLRQNADTSIYVFGQVGTPGRYAFNDKLGFVDILSAADGPTKDADIHNIRVTHRDGSVARVSKLNLARYFETGDETLLPRVLSGDTIYVPEKGRNWLDQDAAQTVRVLGSVNAPGNYPFDDSKTLLDLLAEAGGTAPTAYTRKIVVMHTSCCNNLASTFDMHKFTRSGDAALLPALRPGDTVYVPDMQQSNWNQFMGGVKDVFSMMSILSLVGVL